MTPDDYSKEIFKLYPIHDINMNALGLCGEAGEFANKLKKRTLYTDKLETSTGLIEELGDVLWHVSQCATLLGSSLEDLMLISLKKTRERNGLSPDKEKPPRELVDYCDDCTHLSLTEKEQDEYTHFKPPHVCGAYDKTLYHYGQHPKSPRLTECTQYKGRMLCR